MAHVADQDHRFASHVAGLDPPGFIDVSHQFSVRGELGLGRDAVAATGGIDRGDLDLLRFLFVERT